MTATKFNKRRILIAAIAVVGILCVPLVMKSRDSDTFFDYLAQHPTACDLARYAYTLAGKQDEFDSQLFVSMALKKLEELKKAESQLHTQ